MLSKKPGYPGCLSDAPSPDEGMDDDDEAFFVLFLFLGFFVFLFVSCCWVISVFVQELNLFITPIPSPPCPHTQNQNLNSSFQTLRSAAEDLRGDGGRDRKSRIEYCLKV